MLLVSSLYTNVSRSGIWKSNMIVLWFLFSSVINAINSVTITKIIWIYQRYSRNRFFNGWKDIYLLQVLPIYTWNRDKIYIYTDSLRLFLGTSYFCIFDARGFFINFLGGLIIANFGKISRISYFCIFHANGLSI